jgi:hypothetical protein
VPPGVKAALDANAKRLGLKPAQYYAQILTAAAAVERSAGGEASPASPPPPERDSLAAKKMLALLTTLTDEFVALRRDVAAGRRELTVLGASVEGAHATDRAAAAQALETILVAASNRHARISNDDIKGIVKRVFPNAQRSA